MKLAPFQMAIILGTTQQKIMSWIREHKLSADINGRYISIELKELIRYLYCHPEDVGRIYCDDIPGYITNIRTDIVNHLEEFENAN